MKSPHDVLATIPGFAGAEIVSRLSGGPTNHSFEVEKGGERYVLRLDKPEAARLGLDRQGEKAVCAVIADAGLGDPAVYFDAEAGVYLRRFVPGRSWEPRDLENPDNLERLAALLSRIHALPPAGRAFKPLKAAGRYARQIGTREAGELFGRAATAYALVRPSTPALCHNDLVCQNVVEGEGLTLIDWEYAGIGDPFFDLAVVVQHHGLEEDLAQCFLHAYLDNEPVPEQLEQLQVQCRFYQSLLNLWYMRVNL